MAAILLQVKLSVADVSILTVQAGVGTLSRRITETSLNNLNSALSLGRGQYERIFRCVSCV